MKHHLFLYAGLLGTLLSVGASQSYASDVGSADILSYNNTSTVTRAATPERMALRKLFHTPQFNVIDPVDQFALDWNGFTPLGSIITHDMLAATEREAAKLGEKAREKLLDANDAQQPVDAVLPAESRDAALGRALEPAGTDRREPPSTGPATAGAPAGKPTESNTGT